MYAGCPIFWCRKLQTKIALSTKEAEYFALSHSMWKVIPFLNLVKEIHNVFPLPNSKPTFFCKVFKDNHSCINFAESPKFTHCMKHI
ncbi:hypothetical protein ACHAXS_001225, partial [Conticribra weissflogii]